jgi:2',3'-cyclic-nucleotide 2'-phosphodiesterase (5'-nucleotidase family)
MRRRPFIASWLLLASALAAFGAGVRAAQTDPPLVTLSIVGTSDLHGAALPASGLGGLPLLAGFVNNLRAARAADHGAVVLLDSGDTFQGGIESDLSEGAMVVAAYNAIGYTAEAIGNHDFDFGSVDDPGAAQTAGDLRGAIKARAAEARFPFLAANLIDEASGRVVEWPNVHRSVLIDAAGVKVGIIGVITIDALRSTIAANVQGLRIAPLAPAIVSEATKLRAEGAAVVIVAAHAGGRCTAFADPSDLSSCDQESEIFRVAHDLPRGLVDVIAAGHTHAGIAHRVNGIAIIEPFQRGQAFGRIDMTLDRATKAVRRAEIFAPRMLSAPAAGETLNYEGRPVAADASVARAMQPALDRVRRLQATPLGVTLPAAIVRGGDAGSPLGNIFADALRHAVPGADVAVINTATRGLWADLPAGALTFGALYDVFPFDNRVARITLTGSELARWVEGELTERRGTGLGISGLDVRATCTREGVHAALLRGGTAVGDSDRLLVVTIGGPTLSGNIATRDPLGGGPPENSTVVREAVEDWLRRPGNARPRGDRVQMAPCEQG